MSPPPPPPPSTSSPATSIRNLNKALGAGRLERVYLLHGQEEFLKEAKLERLVEVALEPQDRDFNLDVRQGADLTAEALDALLNTPPLLATRRVVVIKDVASIKKGARSVLDRYLASPAADLVLILVVIGALTKSDKEVADKCTSVEFQPLSRSELEQWVEHRARNNLGINISQPATALLLSAVGEDLPQLASELDKLASYSADGSIDVGDVEDLVGIRHGETLADLLDAVAARDAGRALPLLEHVLAQPRTAAVPILLALTAQTMGIAYARALLDEGEHASRLGDSLFSFLRVTKGVLTARPWGEAVRVWARAAEKWTAAELESACDALLRTDITLKETRASSDEQILTSLILELCAGKKTSATVLQR